MGEGATWQILLIFPINETYGLIRRCHYIYNHQKNISTEKVDVSQRQSSLLHSPSIPGLNRNPSAVSKITTYTTGKALQDCPSKCMLVWTRLHPVITHDHSQHCGEQSHLFSATMDILFPNVYWSILFFYHLVVYRSLLQREPHLNQTTQQKRPSVVSREAGADSPPIPLEGSGFIIMTGDSFSTSLLLPWSLTVCTVSAVLTFTKIPLYSCGTICLVIPQLAGRLLPVLAIQRCNPRNILLRKYKPSRWEFWVKEEGHFSPFLCIIPNCFPK